MTAFNPIKALSALLFDDTSRCNKTASSGAGSVQFVKKLAIVSSTIVPFQGGRVQFQGSWWPARCDQEITLLPGDVVQVIGRQNITLLVQPVRQVIASSTC